MRNTGLLHRRSLVALAVGLSALCAASAAHADTPQLTSAATARINDDSIQGVVRRVSPLTPTGGDASAVAQYTDDLKSAVARPKNGAALGSETFKLARRVGALPDPKLLGWVGLTPASYQFGWKFGTGANAKWVHFGVPSRTPVHTDWRDIGFDAMRWQHTGDPAPDGGWTYPQSAFYATPTFMGGSYTVIHPLGTSDYVSSGNVPCDRLPLPTGFTVLDESPVSSGFWTCNDGPTAPLTGLRLSRNAVVAYQASIGYGDMSLPVPYANQTVTRDTGGAGITDPGVSALTGGISGELTNHPADYPTLIPWLNHEADPADPNSPDPTVAKPPTLAFSASAAEVEEPAHATFTATWSGGDQPSPYDVRILDEDDATLATCGIAASSDCATELGGWEKLHEAEERTVRAQIVDGTKVLAEKSATVTFKPHVWELSLDASDTEVEVDPAVGSASVDLTSSVSDSDQPSPYQVRVVDADSDTAIGGCVIPNNPHCGGSASGTGLAPHPVRHFRAEVVVEGDSEPFATATAEVYFHNPTADPAKVGDFDLDLVTAALMNSDTDPCLEIRMAQDRLRANQLIENTNLTDSSLSDAQIACEAARGAGLTTRQQVAAAIVAAGSGGAILVAILAHGGTVGQPSPTPVRVFDPSPPMLLPPLWDETIDAALHRMLELNPDSTKAPSDLLVVARQCVWMAAQVGLDVDNCGRKWLPIFVTGEQNPSGKRTQEAAEHDLDALKRFPQWFVLNTVRTAERKGNREWYQSKDPCPDATTDIHCDEFPFGATEQGGEYGRNRTGMQPDLKLIPQEANTGQGGMLVSFYDACDMRSGTPQAGENNPIGGDPYLTIPVPTGMTSGWLCNGKTPADQPPQPFAW